MAQSQLYFKRAQISCLPEVTVDTQVTPPTIASLFLARDITVTFDGGNFDPNYHMGSVLNDEETPGPLSMTMSYEVDVKGSGDAGDVAVELDDVWKSCGLSVTAAVGVSHTYRRVSTFAAAGGDPAQSYSFALLLDGNEIAMRGCFSNPEFTFAQADVCKARITTMGAPPASTTIYTTQALLVSAYQTTRAIAFRGATCSLFGVTPVGITNFSLNLNNNLQMGPDVNEPDGFYGARIVPGGRPTGTLEAEFPAFATKDWIEHQRLGTSGAVTTGAVGATDNAVNIDMNECQLRPISLTNRNDIAAATYNFAGGSVSTSLENTAGDDFEMTFT